MRRRPDPSAAAMHALGQEIDRLIQRTAELESDLLVQWKVNHQRLCAHQPDQPCRWPKPSSLTA